MFIDVSSCTGPKEWKGVVEGNAGGSGGGAAHLDFSIFSGLRMSTSLQVLILGRIQTHSFSTACFCNPKISEMS